MSTVEVASPVEIVELPPVVPLMVFPPVPANDPTKVTIADVLLWVTVVELVTVAELPCSLLLKLTVGSAHPQGSTVAVFELPVTETVTVEVASPVVILALPPPLLSCSRYLNVLAVFPEIELPPVPATDKTPVKIKDLFV